MRESLAPTAVFKSRKVGAYGARRPTGQCQGPRRRPWPCVISALLPNIYPSNAVYVELASLSYCIDVFFIILPSVVRIPRVKSTKSIIIIIKNEMIRVTLCTNAAEALYIVNAYMLNES